MLTETITIAVVGLLLLMTMLLACYLDHDHHYGERTHLPELLQIELHPDAEHEEYESQVGKEVHDELGILGFTGPIVGQDDTGHKISDDCWHLQFPEDHRADASQKQEDRHVYKQYGLFHPLTHSPLQAIEHID